MALPAFGAGQRVSVSEMGRLTAPGGVYSVVRAMPSSSGPTQYKIKSDTEAFERIIEESRLVAVDHV